MRKMTTFDKIGRSTICLCAVFTILFWAVSCKKQSDQIRSSPPSLPDISPVLEKIGTAGESIKESADKIGVSADKIDNHTTKIEENTPIANKPILKPEIDGIRIETTELRNVKSDLLVTKQQLSDTQSTLSKEEANVKKWVEYAGATDSKNAKLMEEIRVLKDQGSQMFKRNMAYLGMICTIGIGISLVLGFWARSKTALMVAIGFAITLAVATAVSIFLETIALVTICVIGVAFLIAIGYMGWQFMQDRKVEKELVQTGEIAKQYLPPDIREHLFGYGAEPGKIDQIQSNTTKERVKKIRQYNPKANAVKLAPSLPEYWKPPYGAKGHLIDPYNASPAGYSAFRDTIV